MACAFQEAYDKNELDLENTIGDEDEPSRLEEYCDKEKARFNIPEQMNIYELAVGSPLLKSDVPAIKKFVTQFVQGSLTKEDMGMWYWHLEEFAECDYGWVLLGKPLWYYSDDNEDGHYDKILDEVVAIGTRSRKKKSLPPPSRARRGEEVESSGRG